MISNTASFKVAGNMMEMKHTSKLMSTMHYRDNPLVVTIYMFKDLSIF